MARKESRDLRDRKVHKAKLDYPVVLVSREQKDLLGRKEVRECLVRRAKRVCQVH